MNQVVSLRLPKNNNNKNPLKLGQASKKETRKSSSHPFVSAFAVSLREANLCKGLHQGLLLNSQASCMEKLQTGLDAHVIYISPARMLY